MSASRGDREKWEHLPQANGSTVFVSLRVPQHFWVHMQKDVFNFVRKHCKKKKGNQWFILIITMKNHFAHTDTTSTACASSISIEF